jgi:hypothetical protein
MDVLYCCCVCQFWYLSHSSALQYSMATRHRMTGSLCGRSVPLRSPRFLFLVVPVSGSAIAFCRQLSRDAWQQQRHLQTGPGV